MTSPAFTQVAFRFRNDDGNETGATWRQTQNTNDTVPTNTNFRVRFLIDETNVRAWTNKVWNLYYSLNSGTYTAISDSTPIKGSLSSYFANGANTTSQLTGGSGTFVGSNAAMLETNTGATNTGAAGYYFDIEWCLTIDSTLVANNDTIDLRIYDGSTALAAYTNTPRITVSEAAPREGTLSKTLDGITKTLAGGVEAKGTLSKTLGDISRAAAGGVEVKGRTRVGY